MDGQPEFRFDLGEEFPHLSSAPIVEAVIQWTARAESSLVAASFQEQLVCQLAEYSEPKIQHKLQLSAEISTDGSSKQTREDAWHGIRFDSEDGRNVAQFNRDGFVFSRLYPYEEWGTFSEEAIRLWDLHRQFAKPSEVHQLSVRFINRIPVSDTKAVDRFLKEGLRMLPPWELPSKEFFFQNTYGVPGHPFQIDTVQTLQPSALSSDQKQGLILDINVSTTKAIPCDDPEMVDTLLKMRWLKDKVFFGLLTHEAIEDFKKE